MANADITSLIVQVRSDNISNTTKQLQDFVNVSVKAEAANIKLGNSSKPHAESQKASAATTEALIAKMQRQVDLLGANTSQTNTYTAAMKNLGTTEQHLARALGAEVDAYKRLSKDQGTAIKMNGSLDASYKKLTTEANKYYDSQKKAQGAGNALNELGQRQQAYTRLSQAQGEAIKMNTAFDASLRRQQAALQGRDIERHNASVRAYSQAHAEAIRMNALFNAQQQAGVGAIGRNAAALRSHNNAMREGNAAARGLAGSLGALWMTYSAFTGMAVGVAIGAALKGIFTIGKDVEHILESIRVKGIESVESINMLRDAIMDIGTGVHGPQAVAEALQVLILAGLNAQQAAVGVRDALNLSIIGGTTIEKAAEALVTVGTALGYTAEGYGRVADVIAKTAAISLASVDSIANTFKQASAVGKMYGVTLVDLGVQTAALSNLMVKGTAAGTAIKNFYSQLASGSKEVTTGLAQIGLTIQDLKDTDGNFKSFVDVMKTLRGPTEGATTGMNSLTSANQKNVQAMLTNERGNRLFTESLSLVRKEGTLTATALEDMVKKVDESYAFAVVGAIAMSMTIESQFKSVKNTLQVTLVKAFQDIQPELSLVAVRMKAAFNSPEFIEGIQALAKGTANLAVFIAENASGLWDMLRALIAFKAASFVVGMLIAIAEALVTLRAAFVATRIAAIAFQVAIGGLTLVLAAGAAAWAWWATERDEATNSDSSKAALNYMDDFTGKLNEEAERLEKQLKLMKEGKSARDAETQAMREQQLALVKLQGTKVVFEAQQDLFKLRNSLSAGQNAAIERSKKGIAPQYDTDKEAVAIAIAGEKALQTVMDTTARKYAEAEKAQERVVAASKANATEADKQAKKSREVQSGTGVIPGVPDKAALNDAYREVLNAQDGYITKATRALADFEKQQQSMFKAGKISKLEMIYNVGEAQVAASAKVISALQAQESVASKRTNGGAAARDYHDKITQEIADQAARQEQVSLDSLEYVQSIRQSAAKLEIKELEAKGQFVKAEQVRFDTDSRGMYASVALAAEKYGDKFPVLIEYMKQLKAAQKASMDSAAIEEASAAFENLRGAAANIFKGLVADNEGAGIAGLFAAATLASEQYAASLPALEEKLLALKLLMEAPNAPPEATKNFNEAQAGLQNIANNQKTMWASVGESITKSLGDAFGSAGKAAGQMALISMKAGVAEEKLAANKIKDIKEIQHSTFDAGEISQKMSKLNVEYASKERSANVAMYSEMAGAAKGFFEEGSAGYRAMEAAQRVLTIISLIESAKRMIAFAMENVALTVTVAAIATLAALLGGSSGKTLEEIQAEQKNRIASQGAGTTLGSENIYDKKGRLVSAGDKSESIANSLSMIEQYAFEDLEYSNKMLTAMQAIASALTGVSKSLTLTQGLMSGTSFGTSEGTKESSLGSLLGSVFGGKKTTTITGSGIDLRGTVGQLADGNGVANQYEEITKTKSGGWFSSGSTKQSRPTRELADDVVDSFAKTFSAVRDGLVEVGSSLGLGATQLAAQINAIPVNLTAELRGLKGKELEAEITAVFSAHIDLITKQALAIVTPYQMMGEGLFETAVRVANSSRVIDLELQSIGMAFGAVGTSSIAARMALVDLMGGLEEFTSKTDFFKDNFLTEAQRMAPVTAAVTKEMARLNASSIDTIDEFARLVSVQDLSTVAGQKMYASLMTVAPVFYKATEYAADLAEGIVSLTNAQQRAMDLIDKKRSQLQESYDSESSALQDTIDKMKSFVEGLKSFKQSLLTGSASPLTNGEKYAQAFAKFNETSLLAKNGDEAAQKEFQTVANNLLAASKIYNASGNQYLVDFNRVISETTALVGSSEGQVSVAQASLDALNLQVSGLLDINKSVMSVTQAVQELQVAIAGGRSEGLTSAQMGLAAEEPTFTKASAGDMLGALKNVFGGIDGSHANGLSSVPFDGYRAELHKGEQVLTANQAVNYKQMGTLDMAPLVAEIKSLRSELTQLRSEQAAQTGKLIMSNYDANQRAAGDVVEGVDKSINSAAKRETPALN